MRSQSGESSNANPSDTSPKFLTASLSECTRQTFIVGGSAPDAHFS
jgi:hypothetical protein